MRWKGGHSFFHIVYKKEKLYGRAYRYEAEKETYREGRRRRLGRLQPYTSNSSVESHPKKVSSPMVIIVQPYTPNPSVERHPSLLINKRICRRPVSKSRMRTTCRPAARARQRPDEYKMMWKSSS